MFRTLVIPALALLLLLPSLGNTSANHVKLLTDTVRAFQWNETNTSTGAVTLATHCSVFSVNPKNRGWMTAAHCIVDENGTPYAAEYFITGHPARVVEVNIELDLALVQTTDWGVPVGLKLARKAPVQGDSVENYGFSFGEAHPFYYVGRVSSTEFADYTYVDITTIGGQSGSPVLDSEGRVIGVCHVSWGGSPFGGSGPLMGITLFDAFRVYDRGWVFSR